LGITGQPHAASGGLDWDSARRRLTGVGASSFHLERLAPEGYRFTCLLPTANANRSHRVEAVAATEAEAVQLALNRAEQWAGGR
jgi:hypothetical protein